MGSGKQSMHGQMSVVPTQERTQASLPQREAFREAGGQVRDYAEAAEDVARLCREAVEDVLAEFFQDGGFEGVGDVDVQGVVSWVHRTGRLEHDRTCGGGDEDGWNGTHVSLSVRLKLRLRLRLRLKLKLESKRKRKRMRRRATYMRL